MEAVPLESVKAVSVGSSIPRKRRAILSADLKQLKRAAKQMDTMKMSLVVVCQECQSAVKVSDGEGGVQMDCQCATREVI